MAKNHGDDAIDDDEIDDDFYFGRAMKDPMILPLSTIPTWSSIWRNWKTKTRSLIILNWNSHILRPPLPNSPMGDVILDYSLENL